MTPGSVQFRLRTIFIAMTVFALVLGIVVGLHRSVSDMLYDVYVPSSAGFLVIEHMKANQGEWPRSWDELHQTFSRVETNGYFRGFRWEEYPRRVGIDFTADPATLAAVEGEADEPPFRVIWSLAGPEAKGPVNPNEYVFEYLKSSKRAAAGGQ